MKKPFMILILVFIFVLVHFFLAFAVLFIPYGNDSDEAARVAKISVPSDVSEAQIAEVLVRKMMNPYRFRNFDWIRWVWSYEIVEIKIDDEYKECLNVEIHVKPVFPGTWRDFWTFTVKPVGDGWVRVDYYMMIEEIGDYYVLRGPFSGG